MIEFFTFWGRFLRRKTQNVHFFAALLMSAGVAQAGAWEEFETRCLVPIENVEPPNTHGLTKIDLGSNYLSIATHIVPSGEHGFWARTLPDGGDTCAVHVGREHPRTGHQPLRSGFDAWIAKEISSGRYIEIVAKPHPEEIRREFLSTDWREPKLHLYLSIDFMGTSLGVLETDLES